MNAGTQQWIEDEFAGLDLGDVRLDKRAKLLMSRLAARLTASVPMACNGWSETIAAYRFLRNDEVDWQDILVPHWTRTCERMQAQPVVLCLQDTTELDFNGQQTALGLSIQGLSQRQIETLKSRMEESKRKLKQVQSAAEAQRAAILEGMTGEHLTGDLLTATMWGYLALHHQQG